MTKKIVIDFKKNTFESHQQKYEYFESCKKAINKEVNSLLETPIQIKDFTNCVAEFFDALEIQKKKVNNLNLSSTKLAEVLELDVTRLQLMEREISILNPTKPDAEHYKTYAETEEEIERFNLCNDALKSIDALRKYGVTPNVNFAQAFKQIIYFDISGNTLKANIEFIKNGR